MAFTFTAFTYILALILDAFLIFFSVFHVIAFDELKNDYKNPISQCNTLNPVRLVHFFVKLIFLIISLFNGLIYIKSSAILVLPEFGIHFFFNFLFLICGEWFTLILNAPLIAYHIYRYKNRPIMSSPGLYDPTTIMNADQLSHATKEGWAKLAFYLLSFFYYLYGMIYNLTISV
ncbi:cornichon-like protein [Sarcoptes scabiei]|uniref:Cornichon-like protein n=1 Tax=Sarcoptes scabiei TaxID=52283 RepID=A0A132AIQ5_SARSC|nr:cornichon-like protein [Sarcoptes scabiei]